MNKIFERGNFYVDFDQYYFWVYEKNVCDPITFFSCDELKQLVVTRSDINWRLARLDD